MLAALEPLLASERPALVLVYGDTNSTLAGALAAAQGGIPVAHVEAGMRSYDRSMPEELNRVLTDHASDLLLCSSEAPAEILRGERVRGEIEVVGDVMVDVAQLLGPRARGAHGGARAVRRRAGRVPARDRAPRRQRRRPGSGSRRSSRCSSAVPGPVVLPLHPRTGARLDAAGLRARLAKRASCSRRRSATSTSPRCCTTRARVLTDSGGVQKEAYLAGVPCVTLRATTGVDGDRRGRLERARRPRRGRRDAALERRPPAERPPLYGDGRAGERVAAALARRMGA